MDRDHLRDLFANPVKQKYPPHYYKKQTLPPFTVTVQVLGGLLLIAARSNRQDSWQRRSQTPHSFFAYWENLQPNFLNS